MYSRVAHKNRFLVAIRPYGFYLILYYAEFVSQDFPQVDK